MKITDGIRNTEINMSDSKVAIDGTMEMVANAGSLSDVVWFYMNEEQAREVVRHLNRVFDLGLHG